MPRRDPVSIFWGPHRGFEDLAQWPPTVNLHLQLHGLQPGDLATPPLPPQLFTPKILLPTGIPGTWGAFSFPFGFSLDHRLDGRRLLVQNILDDSLVFTLANPYAINVWAYNLLTDPAGNFTFNGSATLSWKVP